jgi:hypothetical protein
MTERHRAHLVNGVAPVRGCDECAAMVRAAKRNASKTPEGRLPPWIWDDKQEDQ